jgi:hypothetical protein
MKMMLMLMQMSMLMPMPMLMLMLMLSITGGRISAQRGIAANRAIIFGTYCLAFRATVAEWPLSLWFGFGFGVFVRSYTLFFKKGLDNLPLGGVISVRLRHPDRFQLSLAVNDF